MCEKGFDSEKYLAEQSAAILERAGKFGDKLYIEFGGKLICDFHASRVLPGFDPDAKIKLLQRLKDKVDIVICIHAGAIEEKKVRADFGLSYDADETDFITAIGSIEQDPSAGAYVMVYTSVKTDSYEGAPTVQYGEMTLYQSGVGVKDMTVEDKTVILFRLEVYEF